MIVPLDNIIYIILYLIYHIHIYIYIFFFCFSCASTISNLPKPSKRHFGATSVLVGDVGGVAGRNHPKMASSTLDLPASSSWVLIEATRMVYFGSTPPIQSFQLTLSHLVERSRGHDSLESSQKGDGQHDIDDNWLAAEFVETTISMIGSCLVMSKYAKDCHFFY